MGLVACALQLPLPPRPPPGGVLMRIVGRLVSCASWLACSRDRNSVSDRVLPLLMSEVPNTASSCESRESCGASPQRQR